MSELGGIAELSEALQGRYTIERELGRGPRGTVYLAWDVRRSRTVGLKILRPDLVGAPRGERLLHEIARIAGLDHHPHILPILDWGEVHGWLFYAMPYVEGESLRQRLDRESQLPVDITRRIVQGIARALDHAHRAGVLHLDIKPENVLLSYDPDGGPHPLVADFGIAVAPESAGEPRTSSGLALATPAYMSPEQATGSEGVDRRSDLYALACVAYEMLAGIPPFTGSSATTILARHAVDSIPPLRTVRAAVPEPVTWAIERALAKVPADRFDGAGAFAEALSAERIPQQRRLRFATTWRTTAVVAVAMVLALAAVAWMRRRAPGRHVIPSAARIAVLPLQATADTALTRLGRDLATTLSASLDGVGGIETADRMTVSRETYAQVAISQADARALARRLGARSILRGTVTKRGTEVRLDLGLFDAETLGPLGQTITVAGHPDSLGALTDSVVWGLLRQVWQGGARPSPSPSAVTTHSVTALRSFLDGEREMEKDEWEAAELAYKSALAGDSAFVLAHFRYLLSQYWQEKEIEPTSLDGLLLHRHLLPERDRLLVEAWSAARSDSLPLELQRYHEVVRRFPDYWPAWFLLGDRLYHVGPLAGYDWRDTQDALERAVAVDARLEPAWMHLFFNASGKDTIEGGRALTRVLEFTRNEVPAEPVAKAGFLLIDAVSRSGGAIGPDDAALADSMARLYVSAPSHGFQRSVWPWTFLWVGFPAAQVDLNTRVLRHRLDSATAAAQLRGIAWSWAERGGWDSALTAMGRAVRMEPSPESGQGPTAIEEFSLAVLGVWLGGVESARAEARRPAARALLSRSRDRYAAGDVAWLDGLLAFARGDRRALSVARGDARRSGSDNAELLDGALAAFDRALAGDRVGAGRDLAALEQSCVNQASRGRCEFVSPSIAVRRLSAATWLLEGGDTVRAARLLTWHEAAIGGWPWSASYAVTPLAYLMLARIEDARGDRRSARADYEQFLRRYDSPMLQQRHLVQEARLALGPVEGGAEPETGP